MSATTHQQLCDIAVRWLKRQPSANGAGCHVAFSEVRSGWDGEIPDAIGWRAAGTPLTDGSIVVECKLSRSDFLADAKKPHRNGLTPGLGVWRYYLCPADLIQPEDLPKHWGLLYVTKRGGVKCIVGPYSTGNYREQFEIFKAMRQEADLIREQYMLVKLLSRLNDPEKLNKMLKEATGRAAQATQKLEREIARSRQASARYCKTINELQSEHTNDNLNRNSNT